MLVTARVACCLFLSTGSYHVCTQIYTTCYCFPCCTTKVFGVQEGSLWGCKVGAEVHQPGSRAKKDRTTNSQQPACTHKEHQILTSSEATAFAAQLLDRKEYPTKASQQEF